MARFIIQGGQPIGGTFLPRGNKNAVLPMLASCLLTDQPVVLRNVPLINDVKVMLELLESIGVEVVEVHIDSLIRPRNSGSIHCLVGTLDRDAEPKSY